MYFREYYNGKFPHIDNIQNEDSVLILKDLLNEVMTESNILDFYVNLVKKVKKSGMRVYFKKHPLDNNDSFDNILNNMGVTILDPKVDTELILKSINPKYIYSGTSTVSFTIPVLFDRKVYNYSMIFRKYKTEKTL